MLAALLLAVAAVPLPQGDSQQPASAAADLQGDLHGDLQAGLARLVDASSARARRLVVEQLTEKGHALDEWLAACRAFGAFDGLDPGQNRQVVELLVDGNVQETEVFLWVPKSYDPKVPAPLLLWGHGAGGTGARQFRQWEALAEELGMLILAPTEGGGRSGWGFTGREREAQMQALRWARRRCNVDENAIFVGGHSRGGHMTWDLTLRFPDLWAGAIPCIGGPRMALGEHNNLRYWGNVLHLPIRCLQGSKDDPRLLLNLRLLFEVLGKHKAQDAVFREFPELGHSYELGGVDWRAFFALRRDPLRPRVRRIAADPAETRAGWARITAFERNVAVAVTPRVSAAAWERLDEYGQRRLLLDRLGRHNAELAVRHKGKGRFTAESAGVAAFELLLPATMFGKKNAVEVRWNRKTHRFTAEPSVDVLLTDFGERFDRTFLPVARIEVR